MQHRHTTLISALILGLAAAPALANDPVVENVRVSADGSGSYAFAVTIRHTDTGWDHYADGRVLGTRVLYHPHENEQPFTRSLGRVQVPVGITEVFVRAHDKVHGDGKTRFRVKLPPRR